MRGRPIGRVYVLKPEPGKERPYETEELDAARRFVDRVAGRDLSQADLDAIYQECDPSEIEPEKVCPFLDSGPFADAKEESFRETDEFAVRCVLDHEVEKVLDLIARKQPIDGLIVPVPYRLTSEPNRETSRLPRWLRIAEMSRYDKRIGFDDRKRPDGEDRHS